MDLSLFLVVEFVGSAEEREVGELVTFKLRRLKKELS